MRIEGSPPRLMRSSQFVMSARAEGARRGARYKATAHEAPSARGVRMIAATPSAHPFAEADGPPLRLAFVGQTTYFASCSLQEPAGGILPVFIEFRAGADAGSMVDAL